MIRTHSVLAKPIGLGRGRGGGVMGEPKLELPNLCGASHWHLEALPSDVSLSASRVQAAVAIADDGHLVRGEHESHRHDDVRQQGPDTTPPQPAVEGATAAAPLECWHGRRATLRRRIVSGLALYTECSHLQRGLAAD